MATDSLDVVRNSGLPLPLPLPLRCWLWRPLMATFVCTWLVACATPEPLVTRFECESGQTIDVRFIDDKAHFVARGKTYELPAETLDDYRIGMTRMVVRPSGMTLQFGDEVVYWGCQELPPVTPEG